jgi:hypothetical protein
MACVAWLAGAVLAPASAEPATNREAQAQRVIEVMVNIRSYHQSAVREMERLDYRVECSGFVRVTKDFIRWNVSDQGMLTGGKTPWGNSGLPDVELSPGLKDILREIANDLIADIDKRLERVNGVACPPPETQAAESTGVEGSTPGGGNDADLEERIADLEATTARKEAEDADLEERVAELEATTAEKAVLPSLIVVVTNPDGSIIFPGAGRCFGPVDEKGNIPKVKCPKAMPPETEMQQGIRRNFGAAPEPDQLRDQYGKLMFDSQSRPILFPSWSDFQVTPEYAETLKSADEPLYLPYKWNEADSGVEWTQEDLRKAARKWAGVAIDGGLSDKDIEKLQKMQIEAPPAGSLKSAPNAGKPTTSKASGKKETTQPAPRKETTQPAPRNEARDEVIRGVIQFGIGKALDRHRMD